MNTSDLSRLFTFAAGCVVAAGLTAHAQAQYLLDNNLQEGSGGVNAPQPEPDYEARNAIITGNVPGTGYFRGNVPYTAPSEFRGRTGSSDLFRFRARSAGNTSDYAPSTSGYQLGQGTGGVGTFQSLRREQGIFLREGSGVSVGQLEAAGNPSQMYLPPRGAEVPPIADQTLRSGAADLPGLDRRLGMTQMPDGRLLEVRASPVSGVRMLEQPGYGVTDDAAGRLLDEARADPQGPSAARIQMLRSVGIEPRDLARMPGVVLGDQLRSALMGDGAVRRSPVGVGVDPDPTRALTERDADEADAMGEGEDAGAAMPRGLPVTLRRALLNRQQADRLEEIDPTYGALMRRLRDQVERGGVDQPDAEADAEDDADEAQGPDAFGQALPEVTEAQLERAARVRINALRRATGQDPLGENEPLPDDQAEPLGLAINEDRLDPQLLVLLRAIRDSGVELESLNQARGDGEAGNEVSQLMEAAGRAFREQRYFDAAGVYRTVQTLEPAHTMARVGQLHSELAAGMFRSAGRTLRQLAADRPELLGAQYGQAVLPPRERMLNVQQQLLDLLGFSGEPDAGLLLAYLGYQGDAQRLVRYGLNLAQSRAPKDPLIPLLAAVWLEQDDAAKAVK